MALWEALAGIQWKHENDDVVWFTWRTAAHFVADIVGVDSDYMDFYGCGQAGLVRDDILAALSAEGWHPADEVDEE
jgi:hypothetical protein